MNIEQIKQKITQLNSECDLTALLHSFCQLHYENTDRDFEGDVGLIIYDRSKAHIIEDIMDERMRLCLSGWIPDKNRKITKYDFILFNPPLLDIVEVNNILAHVKNYVTVLPMRVIIDKTINQAVVGICMDIIQELQQTPKPILN
jgi:hypothetical protein